MENLDFLKKSLRAYNHKLRLKIIDFLRENELLTVTDLYIKLRIEQSVASQHLAILLNANLVFSERSGKCKYYKVNEAEIKRLLDYCKNWADAPSARLKAA